MKMPKYNQNLKKKKTPQYQKGINFVKRGKKNPIKTPKQQWHIELYFVLLKDWQVLTVEAHRLAPVCCCSSYNLTFWSIVIGFKNSAFVIIQIYIPLNVWKCLLPPTLTIFTIQKKVLFFSGCQGTSPGPCACWVSARPLSPIPSPKYLLKAVTKSYGWI